MKRPSIRLLLLGPVLISITVGFAAFAIYIDWVEQKNRIADIDTELRRAERGGPPLREGNGPPSDRQDRDEPPLVQLIMSSEGTVMASNTTSDLFGVELLASLAKTTGIQTTAEPHYRVLTSATSAGEVALTALPLQEVETARSQFRLTLVIGGGTILLLVAAIIWILTGYLVRPVTDLATVASRIAEGELATEVGAPSGSRETAKLSGDLHRMLVRLRGALELANEERNNTTRFLADMAHEIRTPLTALKGYSDLYAQGMLGGSSEVDRAMSRIGSESQRLTVLANRMLQLASEGQGVDKSEVFDLGELVTKVVEDLRAAYPEHTVALTIKAEEPVIANGSPAKIHQAVLNLGSNACQFSSTDSPIEVLLAQSTSRLTIQVIDRGPGIDPSDLERVFLPFFRSDDARSRHGSTGAGIGLALTKQIADQHDGHVTAGATPGGGATFTISIPGQD